MEKQRVKVCELIDILQQKDQDAEVKMRHSEHLGLVITENEKRILLVKTKKVGNEEYVVIV